MPEGAPFPGTSTKRGQDSARAAGPGGRSGGGGLAELHAHSLEIRASALHFEAERTPKCAPLLRKCMPRRKRALGAPQGGENGHTARYRTWMRECERLRALTSAVGSYRCALSPRWGVIWGDLRVWERTLSDHASLGHPEPDGVGEYASHDRGRPDNDGVVHSLPPASLRG